ncbi:MAG: hypothetical protein ACK2UH_08095 [Candidatus Promineifilaceae bacterium]
MTKDTLRQLLVVVSVIAIIAVIGLTTALPINSQTTAEISDRFDVFLVPAGYVFSIWGIIYLGLVLYAAYQGFPALAHNVKHGDTSTVATAATAVLLIAGAYVHRRQLGRPVPVA